MKKRKKGTAVRHSRTASRARPKSRAPAGSRHAKGVFALWADCTVAESAALKSALLENLSLPTPVTLDIGCVQRIDTAGIQLIAAFVREREGLGLQVQWRGSAPAFTSATRLLGVASVLKLPEQP